MLGAVVLTAVLGRVLLAVPAVGGFDLRLVAAAHRGLDGPAASWALGIDAAFGPLAAAVLAALAALVGALLRRSVWAGVRSGTLVAVPWGTVEGLKILVRRPRPEIESLPNQLLLPPGSFSFPSGHTAFAAAFCVAILLSRPAGWVRRVGIVLAVLVTATTAWSRVALGVHHPTDVLVSMLLTTVLGILLARLLDSTGPPPSHRRGDHRPRHRRASPTPPGS